MSLTPLGSANAIATVEFKNSFVKFLLHDNYISQITMNQPLDMYSKYLTTCKFKKRSQSIYFRHIRTLSLCVC